MKVDYEKVGNRATAHTLEVLSLFAREGEESLGVTEVSDSLDITKSMAHRALTTLTEHGYLIRDPSERRYALGLGVLRFMPRHDFVPTLGDLASDSMAQLRDLTGETVILAAQSGHNVLVVDGLEGAGPIAQRVDVGRIRPLHRSASGKAILAYLPEDEIEAYLSSASEQRRTLTDPERAAILGELERTRAQGYATCDNDPTHAAGVAFAILDKRDRPWGSIGIGGPVERLTSAALLEVLPAATEIAQFLNRRSRIYRMPLDGDQ